MGMKALGELSGKKSTLAATRLLSSTSLKSEKD